MSIAFNRTLTSARLCLLLSSSSPSPFSQLLCPPTANADDRPATTATAARPHAPSRKASRLLRRKSANEKPRSAPDGMTHRITISAIKTRPPASACGRTIAGESACGKGVKRRGGDGFLGGRIGTAEDGETARPRRCSRRHIRVSTTDDNCTPNPTRHPRLTPAQPPINPRAVGADAFRLTLLRNRALRPYIWPLLFSNN